MSETKSIELRVSVDVGYHRHSVAIGLPKGDVLEKFEIHGPEGFQEFFFLSLLESRLRWYVFDNTEKNHDGNM